MLTIKAGSTCPWLLTRPHIVSKQHIVLVCAFLERSCNIPHCHLQLEHDIICVHARQSIHRVGQDHVYTLYVWYFLQRLHRMPYMTVYLVLLGDGFIFAPQALQRLTYLQENINIRSYTAYTYGWPKPYINIYIRCLYGMISREITIHTVRNGVHIRFWPTLRKHTVLEKPNAELESLKSGLLVETNIVTKVPICNLPSQIKH